jgi:hypothetical protein
MSQSKKNMFDQLADPIDPVETLRDMYGDYTSDLNPRDKGRTWFKSYKQGKVNRKMGARVRTQERQYRQKMDAEASSVATHLDDFEAKLRTIKRF